MVRQFDAEEIFAWLEGQIETTQISWMDHHLAREDELRRQQEVILDGIYAFRQYFLEVPAPAPGQGYQPSERVWDRVIRQRQVAAIDAQISELTAQREAIVGERRPVRGRSVFAAVAELVAEAFIVNPL